MQPIYFSPAQEDWDHCEKHNVKILERIDKLIADIQQHRYSILINSIRGFSSRGVLNKPLKIQKSDLQGLIEIEAL